MSPRPWPTSVARVSSRSVAWRIGGVVASRPGAWRIFQSGDGVLRRTVLAEHGQGRVPRYGEHSEDLIECCDTHDIILCTQKDGTTWALALGSARERTSKNLGAQRRASARERKKPLHQTPDGVCVVEISRSEKSCYEAKLDIFLKPTREWNSSTAE